MTTQDFKVSIWKMITDPPRPDHFKEFHNFFLYCARPPKTTAFVLLCQQENAYILENTGWYFHNILTIWIFLRRASFTLMKLKYWLYECVMILNNLLDNNHDCSTIDFYSNFIHKIISKMDFEITKNTLWRLDFKTIGYVLTIL